MIGYKFNDGGRKAAGYVGQVGDCVCRAIAIATEKPYQEVYDALLQLSKKERKTKRMRRKSHPRSGVYRKTYDKYLKSIGWEWVATMGIGTGCQVHLRSDELPQGRVICRVSKHVVAVVDGVVNDTYDPSREGDRCVYGYYKKSDAV